MAKYTLNNSEEDFNFNLIGLTCNENQYRVIALINDSLKINLTLNTIFPLIDKDNRLFKFSLYHFLDEELHLEFSFIPNSSNLFETSETPNKPQDLFTGVPLEQNMRLIKELPKTDYLLIIKGEERYLFLNKITVALKNISQLIQIQSIEPQELSSRKNLIF